MLTINSFHEFVVRFPPRVQVVCMDYMMRIGVMFRLRVFWAGIFATALAFAFSHESSAQDSEHQGLRSGEFRWQSTGRLVEPLSRSEDVCVAIKDPSVVRHNGLWHLFCSVRFKSKKIQLEHLQFSDWEHVSDAKRTLLEFDSTYIAAPQVFYFTRHKKWYLVYQRAGKDQPYGPWFSTTDNIESPETWTAPKPMYDVVPEGHRWLDFWVICNEQKAYLFHTSNNGTMWRAETALSKFPFGWNRPETVLKGDIFEASETYRIKGRNQYLTIIEAQGDRRRYHKAFLADSLEGKWMPLAATREKPFAALKNVEVPDSWTTNFSHGELIRSGVDEKLEIDADRIQFLYQGVSDEGYRANNYGQIPWALGLATSQ